MNDAAELLSYKKDFDRYAACSRRDISAYHFSSVFLWKDFFKFTFELLGDHLCVFAQHPLGSFLYLPPLGKGFVRGVVDECFKQLNAMNPRPDFSRIENVDGRDVHQFKEDRFKAVLKSREYCYYRKEIAELKGNAYKSKRSDCHQFIKLYAHDYVRFEEGMSDACLRLYDDWSRGRARKISDDIYQTMLKENRIVHALIFQYYRELGLVGRVIKVKGQPKAYTFGYPLNETTFCVLVEVADLEFKGLSAYIFQRFCSDEALAKFPFINVMDDFAMDNVARSKGSYKPQILYSSFVVTQR